MGVETSVVAAVLGLVAVMGGFIIIVGGALYVLSSIGLYTLAKNAGIENEWLAWIPIANLYIWGKLVGSVKVFDYEIPRLELVLPIGTVLMGPIGAIPLIGWLAVLAFAVLQVICMYQLFKIYRPESATLFTVLSVIFMFMYPIFIFIIRNDSPKVDTTYRV